MTEQKQSDYLLNKVKSNNNLPAMKTLSAAVLMGIAGFANANCIITTNSATCDSNAPDYTSTLDFGSVTGATITIEEGATLDTSTNTSTAIVAGENAVITVGANATVRNVINAGPPYEDLIKVQGGTHINIGKNALLESQNGTSTDPNAEIIELHGSDSTINNSGTIHSAGAVAVMMQGANNVITNSGTIHGAHGAVWDYTGGQGMTVINSGVLESDGATAIQWMGGNNTLILEEGSQIIGNVVSSGTSIANLVLGGDLQSGASGDTFNVGLIGTSAQYRNFSSFKKQGTSTWTLNGVASQDIDWSAEQGTLVFGSSTQGNGIVSGNGGNIGYLDRVNLSNAMVLNQPTSLIVDSGSATQSGVISGNGALIKEGQGTLVLTNDNTWQGGTTINAGTLQLGNGNITGTITGDIQNSGNLIFAKSSATTYAGKISGTGTLFNNNNNNNRDTLTLTGDSDYTGLTTNNRTLQLGNGGTTGSITGDILNDGALTFNHSNDITYAGQISSIPNSRASSLIKRGSGVLTLTGQNSDQYTVAVQEGTLELSQNGQFSTGHLEVNAGTSLKLDNAARLTVSGSGYIFGNLSVDVATGGPLITANDVILFRNPTLNVAGIDSTTLHSASEVANTRTTVLQTTGGISGDFASVSFNGAGSDPDYLLVNGAKSADNLSYSVGAELAWTSGGSGANGNFTLTDPADSFNVDVVLADESPNATTAWDGATLTKAGAGTLTLSSLNTYTGATLVNAGTLTTGVADALTHSSQVNVASGATFNLNNFNQQINGLAGAGDITLGSAALTVDNAASNEFDGAISGSGSLAKTGAGTLILGGNNTFTGAATVSSGTLQVGNGGTGGTLTGDVINNAELVFDRSDDSLYAGNGSGSGNVTKNGVGTLTLSGINSWAGTSTVNAGTLALAQAQSGGAGTLVINNAGTLDAAFSNATLTNALSGDGKARISGTGVGLGGDNSAFTGVWDITGGAVATQASQLGGAGVVLDGTASQLTLNNFSSDFSNALSGNGALQINQNSKSDDFTFANSAGSAFTGAVQVQQGNMVLDASGAQALTHATLALSPEGMTTLDADRSIGGLTTGGGTLRMNNSRTDTYTLTTQTLDASAGGTIAANLPATLAPPVIPANVSYFDQDAVRTIQAVNTTGTVNGVGNHLSLYNYDGVTPASAPSLVNINNGATQLGVATYDYGAVVTRDGV